MLLDKKHKRGCINPKSPWKQIPHSYLSFSRTSHKDRYKLQQATGNVTCMTQIYTIRIQRGQAAFGAAYIFPEILPVTAYAHPFGAGLPRKLENPWITYGSDKINARRVIPIQVSSLQGRTIKIPMIP